MSRSDPIDLTEEAYVQVSTIVDLTSGSALIDRRLLLNDVERNHHEKRIFRGFKESMTYRMRNDAVKRISAGVVTNLSNGNQYRVVISQQVKCSCEDFQRRCQELNLPCKHLIYIIKLRTNCTRSDQRLWNLSQMPNLFY